jgi:hypothetical protein
LTAPPNLKAMNAAALVREVLANHKAAGVSFEVAWARALRLVSRGRSIQAREWRDAIEWARPAFEAAYAGDKESSIALDESAVVG